MARHCKRSINFETREAREALKQKGYTYEAACVALSVSYTQISHVLTGRRVSARLLAAIHALPNRKEVA